MRASAADSFKGNHVQLASLEIEQEEPPSAHQEDSIDPHHAVVTGGGDLPSTVLAIIKGMVGPAILYLPHGFATAGYMVALFIMALSTLMYLYSSQCLLEAWKLESHKMDEGEFEAQPLQQPKQQSLQPEQQTTTTTTPLSYPELAVRAFGTRGETIVKLGIAAMQSGVCLTYFIFVPHNLTSSVQNMFGVNIAPNVWLAVMVGMELPLCWIRDIRKFALTNSVANLLIAYGLITCLGFAIQETLQGASTVAWTNVTTHVHSLAPFQPGWFLFIGTSVLMFEGSITLLIPLQESVRKPGYWFPIVYKKVIVSIVLFYTVFAITCWMAFGNDVEIVLTTSLPQGFLATTVQLAYSIAVLLTFPLQFWPCLDIATNSIQMALTNTKCIPARLLHYNILSSILVVSLAFVAVTSMNSLDKVVSLMGSLLGCPIAFVFPPLIQIQLNPNLPTWKRQCNYLCAGVGMVSMVLASIVTILEWNA